jgi:hypothetical protein
MLSELSSPSFVEVKWKPPYCNGAPITQFEVKMTLDEAAPEINWIPIPPQILAENTYDYGFDGRRVTERDEGCKVYSTESGGTKLMPNVRYFFKVRACNSVGWGEWSIPSGFMTKAVKPGKAPPIRCVSCGIHEVSIEWDEPQCHGKEVLRYDLFAAPNVVYIRWVQMSTLLLASTVDSNVSGTNHTEPLAGAELNEPIGKDGLDALICEHGVYIPLSSDHRSYELKGLLPASSYFFMIRAVNAIGIGQFSNITPAFFTHEDKLGTMEPLDVQSVTETDAVVSFRLPFNQGSKIIEAALTLSRLTGPVSNDELNEDGEIHEHLAGQKHHLFYNGQTFCADGEALECIEPKPLTRKVAGLSYALKQNFKDEGLQGPTEHIPSFTVCTGKRYSLQLHHLRPGTSYEATWCCRSGRNWSSNAKSTIFTTDASIPDDPVPLLVFGL